VSLTGTIKSLSANKKISIAKSQVFMINAIDKTYSIAELHLIPQPNHSYCIALYGKNGEGLKVGIYV